MSGPQGWPGSTGGALPERPAVVLNVERYLCLSVDIEKYGTRTDIGQQKLQAQLAQMLGGAAARSGLRRDQWVRQPKGDEDLALIPASEPHAAVVGAFCLQLDAALRVNNRRRGTDRVRLRLAIDEGPVSMGALGFVGRAVVGVSRLVSSAPLRRALAAAAGADLAVIVSYGVHRDWILSGRAGIDAAWFRRVAVAEKELTEEAWLWVPRVDAHTLDLSGEVPDSLPISLLPTASTELVVHVRQGQGVQASDDNCHTDSNTYDPAIPRQLPGDVLGFAGRQAELRKLDSLLMGDGGSPIAATISAISGTAGVGKTALALHWAHRMAKRFPNGQLYVNLRGFDPDGKAMDPAQALRGFLDALGLPADRIPADPDAQAALYRSHLAGRRTLVVLDNARDTAQVRPLLPGSSTCVVLVTSRNQLTGLVAADGAHPITLDLPTPGEARQMLCHRLGAERLRVDRAAVEKVIVACARLPLALAIVAARSAMLSNLSLQSLADELHDELGRLDVLTTDDPQIGVRVVFSWSYRVLSPVAARLFRHLSLHPGPDISAAAAASLATMPIPDLRQALAELVRANLVVEPSSERYAFHDLLRTYAAEQARLHDCEEERHDARWRILDHYLHTAHAAARLLSPARAPITISAPHIGATPEQPETAEQALAWFTAEHQVLLAAVQLAIDSGLDVHVWQLAWSFTHFFRRRGHWRDLFAVQQAALSATQRLGDPSAQARAHRGLATAYMWVNDYARAAIEFRDALQLYREFHDELGQASIHLDLTRVLEKQGHLEDALTSSNRALDLYRAAGHRPGQALALNSMGWFHTLLGNARQGLADCEEALALLIALGDRNAQADTWDSLGYAHHQLGHHSQAASCYLEALDLYREAGDRYFEATALNHLGDTHHSAGNRQSAFDFWQQALTIFDQLDHPDAVQLRTKLAALCQPTRPNPKDGQTR